MSSIVKSKYYRFNGTEWVQFLFETSADLIIETQNYKVMTADERQKISTYLNSFNTANKLVQLNSQGKINVELIPELTDYAKKGSSVTFSSVRADSSVRTEDLTVEGMAFIHKLKHAMASHGVLYVETDLEMGRTYRIQGLPEPRELDEPATRGYVDALVAVGTRPVESVVAATTGNINLSGEVTIDGYTVKEGDRVLVWKQTNKSQNGIYIVSKSSWTKVQSDSTQGAYVFVENGNTHNDWYFFCQDQEGTWIAHGRPDTIKAGAGLTKSGTTLSIGYGAITNGMLAGDITYGKIAEFSVSHVHSDWQNTYGPDRSANLYGHLSNLYSYIKIIRGTEKVDTPNNQTIAGAYTEINKRNRTYTGTSLPGTSGYTAGDLFFLELASS